MSKQRNDRARSLARAGRAALGYVGVIAPGLLAGCSGDVINLGERDNELAAPPHSRCQSSSTLEGSVMIDNQEELDALEGCEVIAGNLDIVAFPSASLRSLHALKTVEGYVRVGGHNPIERGYDGSSGNWVSDFEAYEASIVGWLPSLEGLEQLDTVDSLSVVAPVSSLEPLSALRRINGGHLEVSSDVLETLAGLEGIRGFDSLVVGGAELRDISAIHLPETMDSLLIHAPITVLDVNDLKSALRIDLAGTELADLDAFSNVETVGDVSIQGNPRLRHLDGFNAVRTIRALSVQENGALERLCDFTSLFSLESLQIEDNDNLTVLPSFPAYYEGYLGDLTPATNEPIANVEHIELRGNERLRQLLIPAAWKVVDEVQLIDTQLDAIDFVNLQSVGTLVVTRNPLLSEVNLGALSGVAYLEVTNNHALAPTAFDGVRTLESHIHENAPTP